MEKVIIFTEKVIIFADFILIFTECTKNQDFSRKYPLLSNFHLSLVNVQEGIHSVSEQQIDVFLEMGQSCLKATSLRWLAALYFQLRLKPCCLIVILDI